MPPADPEEWTDEQWISWLKATDEDVGSARCASPVALSSRVLQSTPAEMLGQAMLGMAQAIYGRHDDEVVMVVEGSGEPGDDEPFAVRLDLEHPERSSVVFRATPHSHH